MTSRTRAKAELQRIIQLIPVDEDRPWESRVALKARSLVARLPLGASIQDALQWVRLAQAPREVEDFVRNFEQWQRSVLDGTHNLAPSASPVSKS